MKRVLPILGLITWSIVALFLRAQETKPRDSNLTTLPSDISKHSPATSASVVTFPFVNIYLDSGQSKLAAYQFEFTAETGHVEVVGIEGGDHPAFAKVPPYYDPAALMQQNRVIVASYSTADELPTGKTRVARLHLMVTGEIKPTYVVKLQAAGSPDGKSIREKAVISVSEGAAP